MIFNMSQRSTEVTKLSGIEIPTAWSFSSDIRREDLTEPQKLEEARPADDEKMVLDLPRSQGKRRKKAYLVVRVSDHSHEPSSLTDPSVASRKISNNLVLGVLCTIPFSGMISLVAKIR